MAFTPLAEATILSKRYKIINLIRKGGMGATYRGEDLELGKPVAIKQLIDQFKSPGERESAIHNFLAEVSLLKTINHPQIPQIRDHFVIHQGFFFVMEFVEGKDFSAILEETGRTGLLERDVIEIGIHLCRILRYLHERKPEPIIHRDIKSSNIMKRSQDGKIMLLDFGISRASKPLEGMMTGTLGYAPPEQHVNQTDIRSDMYSLGATLHELATGVRPDPESFNFLPPHEIHPDLSPRFSEIILTATRHNPNERFQDASYFEEALQSLLPSQLHSGEKDSFRECLNEFQTKVLYARLFDLKSRHPNECVTEPALDSMNHFSFVLGARVPYALLVDVDYERRCIRFHMKEGMLPAIALGEISPSDPDADSALVEILARYEAAYKA